MMPRLSLRLSRDDRGSLPLAMLLSLVSASLGALLVPTLLSQNTLTRNEVRRVHALSAAQSGIDVAMGQIRAANTPGAVDDPPVGVASALPCGPFDGKAGAAVTASYHVTIGYYPSDPVGQSAAWLASNAIACAAGAGTPTVPGYALLTSVGSETYGGISTSRTVQSTYVVHTTNANIPGGPISIGGLCFDAGPGAPADLAPITLQECSAGLPEQKFIYSKNLTLQLAGSTSSTGLPYCLDAGPTHSTGKAVVLNPCQADSAYAQPGVTYLPAPAPQPLYRQMWGFSGNNNFMGSLPPNGPTEGDGFCLAAQTSKVAGSPLVLGPCGPLDVSAVVVDPTVGAGRASVKSSQYVNYKQFGRCLDVDAENVANSLISYPCKQVPFGLNTQHDWNQQWVYDQSRKLMMTYPLSGGAYCLQSSVNPLDVDIKVQPCPAAGAPSPLAMQWDTHLDPKLYSYSVLDTITDQNGNCLAAVPGTGEAGVNLDPVRVETCDSSGYQKWNGDANTLKPSPLENTHEK